MKSSNHQDNRVALGVGIAKAQGDAAALAASLNSLADLHGDRPGGAGDAGAVAEHERRSGWPGFRDALGRAGERGGAAARLVASGIESHPVVGGVAAFGLGFSIARVLFRSRTKKPSA